MKIFKISVGLILCIIFVQYFTSCRKETDSSSVDYNLLKDNSLAESSYFDALSISDQASTGTLSYKSDEGLLSGCAQVTRDTVSIPHLITIDFGSINCICLDQKERRGKILVSYTGAYRDSGTVINISFDNYYVNDNKILGSKTVINEGHNNEGNKWYSIHIDGAIVKAGTSDTISWVSDRTRTWLAGGSTLTWLDDVYLINGSTSGISASGIHFNVNITTALRREIGCPYFVSGVLLITRTGKPDISIDFGDGTCNSDVTYTINNVTHNYNL